MDFSVVLFKLLSTWGSICSLHLALELQILPLVLCNLNTTTSNSKYMYIIKQNPNGCCLMVWWRHAGYIGQTFTIILRTYCFDTYIFLFVEWERIKAFSALVFFTMYVWSLIAQAPNGHSYLNSLDRFWLFSCCTPQI